MSERKEGEGRYMLTVAKVEDTEIGAVMSELKDGTKGNGRIFQNKSLERGAVADEAGQATVGDGGAGSKLERVEEGEMWGDEEEPVVVDVGADRSIGEDKATDKLATGLLGEGEAAGEADERARVGKFRGAPEDGGGCGVEELVDLGAGVKIALR